MHLSARTREKTSILQSKAAQKQIDLIHARLQILSDSVARLEGVIGRVQISAGSTPIPQNSSEIATKIIPVLLRRFSIDEMENLAFEIGVSGSFNRSTLEKAAGSLTREVERNGKILELYGIMLRREDINTGDFI